MNSDYGHGFSELEVQALVILLAQHLHRDSLAAFVAQVGNEADAEQLLKRVRAFGAFHGVAVGDEAQCPLTIDSSKIVDCRLIEPHGRTRCVLLTAEFRAAHPHQRESHVVEVSPEGWVLIRENIGGGVICMLDPVRGSKWLDQAYRLAAKILWDRYGDWIAKNIGILPEVVS